MDVNGIEEKQEDQGSENSENVLRLAENLKQRCLFTLAGGSGGMGLHSSVSHPECNFF